MDKSEFLTTPGKIKPFNGGVTISFSENEKNHWKHNFTSFLLLCDFFTVFSKFSVNIGEEEKNRAYFRHRLYKPWRCS